VSYNGIAMNSESLVFIKMPYRSKSWKYVSQFAKLKSINQSDINFCVMTREICNEITEYLEKLDLRAFSSVDEVIYKGEYQKIKNKLMHLPIDPASERRGHFELCSDVLDLLVRFFETTGKESVHLKLEPIFDDQCKYFHVDQTGFRLLCTYRGPGTEWVSNDEVNHEYLGRGDNLNVLKFNARVRSLRPFWIGVLKGGLITEKGLVHRSPPISHREGVQRLLLRIDAR
jgi:hypothetical protein